MEKLFASLELMIFMLFSLKHPGRREKLMLNFYFNTIFRNKNCFIISQLRRIYNLTPHSRFSKYYVTDWDHQKNIRTRKITSQLMISYLDMDSWCYYMEYLNRPTKAWRLKSIRLLEKKGTPDRNFPNFHKNIKLDFRYIVNLFHCVWC